MENITAWVSAICAVISVCATFFTIWWPWHARPQAYWQCDFFRSESGEDPLGGLPEVRDWIDSHAFKPSTVYRVTNSGDGVAFNISVEGYGCEARILYFYGTGERRFYEAPDKLWMIRPADSFFVLVRNDPRQSDIAIDLRWVRQPTRTRHYVYQTFFLRGPVMEVPRSPIPEPRYHAPTLLRYRFENSRLGLSLYQREPKTRPGKWMRGHLWRTLRAIPEESSQDSEPCKPQ